MSFLNPPAAEVRRTRLVVGLASLVITAIVMTAFLVESRWGYMKPDAKIIFFQSWRADRSRAETLADNKATEAAREAKLVESRAYIATLTGPARIKAQEQYDKYVAGNGGAAEIPYVSAKAAAIPAEPPVL